MTIERICNYGQPSGGSGSSPTTSGRRGWSRALQQNGSVAQTSLFAVVCFAALWLCSCASPTPHVGGVWARKREQTVDVADRSYFLTDRASRFRVDARALPPSQQREEFLVNWEGTDVGLVRFEYRQVGQPNQVLQQDLVPGRRLCHVFEVRGDDYRAGGPVSAWRVALWKDGQLLAERKSALW